MAKMTLSETKGYTLIPKGETTFKIMSVDDSKYEEFGKISVKMQTVKGEVHYETFTLKRADGSWNDKALRAWSFFARTCLGDYQAEEIDTQDIVGHYITATVEHTTFIRTKGDHAGEEAEAVRLKNYQSAKGFSTVKSAVRIAGEDEKSEKLNYSDDIDKYLND